VGSRLPRRRPSDSFLPVRSDSSSWLVSPFLGGGPIRMEPSPLPQTQTLTNDQVKATMSPLSQEGLEQLLNTPSTPLTVIYFTASWCGPCRRVNLHKITQFRNDIVWYVCDVDNNPYSLGYCRGKQIPSWLALVNGQPYTVGQSPAALVTIADSDAVCRWLSLLPAATLK